MSREKSCFGILFSFSIIIGIVLGYIIRQGIRFPSVDPRSISAAASVPLEDETSVGQTFLVIGVDNLISDSHLQGAWLATLDNPGDHTGGSLQIILVTLYPVIPENVSSLEQSKFSKPHAPIPVDAHNLSSINSLEPLAFTDQTWSQVIILDEIAMNAAIQFSNLNAAEPISTPTADMFVKSWENPEKSLHQQWGIITTLCEEPEAYSQYSTIQKINNFYGTHILSTLDAPGLLKFWQVVNYKQTDTISCEIYPQLTH